MDMTRPTYVIVRDAIRYAIDMAKPLTDDPKGAHYHLVHGEHEKYLARLGILGEPKRIQRKELGIKNSPDRWSMVRPVNYERAEEVLDKLTEIERNLAPAEERYKEKAAFAQKLARLRLDLEELR